MSERGSARDEGLLYKQIPTRRYLEGQIARHIALMKAGIDPAIAMVKSFGPGVRMDPTPPSPKQCPPSPPELLCIATNP